MGNLFCKQTSIPATSDLSTAIDPTGTHFLHGGVGEDGAVTDGVVGGAFRGAFLRRVFGFPLVVEQLWGCWMVLGMGGHLVVEIL